MDATWARRGGKKKEKRRLNLLIESNYHLRGKKIENNIIIYINLYNMQRTFLLSLSLPSFRECCCFNSTFFCHISNSGGTQYFQSMFSSRNLATNSARHFSLREKKGKTQYKQKKTTNRKIFMNTFAVGGRYSFNYSIFFHWFLLDFFSTTPLISSK